MTLLPPWCRTHCCRNVMEVLSSLRWIFLLILLTDSVIGHVSDGGNPTNKDLTREDTSFSKLLHSSTSISSVTSLVESSKLLNGNGTSTNNNNGSKVDPEAEETERILELQRQGLPWIDKSGSPNVTALLGKTAYLNCRVKNLGDKTVSWIRHRDVHLLTVGRYTYTTDQRFRAVHQPNSEDYSLMIKYPQHRDSGIYECQVSTTPHYSHYIHLNVVEPVTEIAGAPELYVDRGSTIQIKCTVLAPEAPNFIIWNHNSNIISYSSPRGGVTVVTEKGETTTSYLLIQNAKPSDSGRYSCNPSNAAPHSINVHVLNGELPAAMQTGGQMPQQIPLSFCLLSTAILLMI